MKIIAALLALTLQAHAFDNAPLWAGGEKTIAITADTAMTRGSSDKNGDHKAIEAVYRKNGRVFSLKTALDTPQSVKTSDMRDTGFGQVTLGYETEKSGIYASFGTTRNGIPELMYSSVDGLHSAFGMGKARRSPLSKAPATVVSLGARHDFIWEKSCETLCLSGHLTLFGVAGNLETLAGVSALAVVSFKPKDTNYGKRSVNFRAPLDSLPATAVSGTHIYAGVRMKAVAFDRRIEGRINPYRADLVAGVEYRHKRLGVGLELSHSLTHEVYGAKQPAISKVMMRVSWAF
jgi:hypothetical protein